MLSKQNIDRKVKQLLASGAKIIDISTKAKDVLKTYSGTFSNNLPEDKYMKITTSPKLNRWDMYEDPGSIYINNYMSSYNTHFVPAHYVPERVTWHTLISRPLPGRSKCKLVASFNSHSLNTEIEIRIGTSYTLEHRKIGLIGLKGFESENTIMIRGGKFLHGSKLMSVCVMSCPDVISVEGPNWEDIKNDTFWTAFEQDAWELSQVMTVIES
jgi:hypothetical protein